jgi:yecA family protein
VSSLSRRYRTALPDPGELMPPNLRTFAAAPFGDAQRARLAGWLREAGWPRGHMDLVELEGYLVALIAWPVPISAGAWLPPIWGGRGWRVCTKIAARSAYDEFVELVVGFMRDLDRQLGQPSRFGLSLPRDAKPDAQLDALHRWGRGFMTALTLGSQGFKWRSISAGDAVRVIARTTSASAQFEPHTIDGVVSAVATLMEQRQSRGPLGALESAPPSREPMDRVANPESDASSRSAGKYAK